MFSDVLAELVSPVLDSLAAAYDVMVLPIPDGERAKKAAVAVSCWEALGEAGFTRSDAVVTFGGGVHHRPRRVRRRDLAARRAGRARADHAARHGRRGGRRQDRGSTPARARTSSGRSTSRPASCATSPCCARCRAPELVAGLGEVLKCGFIADPAILDLVDDHDAGELGPDSPVLRELVERAVRVKVDVVSADLKETGGTGGHPGREVLNYGHTMAHAIERTENYRIRHGEAVAIGCVYVAELAARAGTLAPEVVERHREVFTRVGLPTTYAKASFEDLHSAMKVDKKSRGSQLRFVVLADLAVPTVLAGPSVADLRDAYSAIGGVR